jgi:P-type conjugative transfer protein TrbG
VKTKPSLAALAVLLITLWACTTTKDLERHPEFVAVAGTKEGAAPAAPENAAAAISAAPSPGGAAISPSSLGAAVTEPPTAGAPAPAGQGPTGSQASSAPAGDNSSASPVIVEKKIYIEKPIYYPESASQTPSRPGDAVTEAMSRGVMKPKDYNGALMLYDYDGGLVYQVYTMPLRVTDVYLEPGEKLIEQPFCGDTTRWTIGGGVSKVAGVDTQHLYLKPSEAGLETTLIVNTDRRIYHLIIKSFKDTFMMAVMWHYPGLGVPLDFLFKDNEKTSSLEREGGQRTDQAEGAASAVAVDPALLSSDYTVSYPKDHPPQWLPELVLDDGGKTYIVLPDTVIHHELPAVFGENGELVNFRVKDNVIVIDRLLRKMQLKLRDVTVDVRKKGA